MSELEDEPGGDSPSSPVAGVVRQVRRRKRRARGPRKKTISVKTITKKAILIGWLEAGGYESEDEHLGQRPETWQECQDQGTHTMCPFVSCKHHLYLDVNPETGSIQINWPDLEPWEIPRKCALSVAWEGGKTLEEVGAIMNLTRERVRQIEFSGIVKLGRSMRRQ